MSDGKFAAVLENNEYIGEIVGYCNGHFFYKIMNGVTELPETLIKQGISFNDDIYYVLYKEPKFNSSREEAASYFGIPVEYMTKEVMEKIGVRKVLFHGIPKKLLNIVRVTRDEYVNNIIKETS
jgi:hypothetical protein